MPKAMRVCSCIGCLSHSGSCPELVQSGRCGRCNRTAEQQRGSSTQRGYGGRTWRVRRRATLRRDPLCVCHDASHGHGPQCLSPSTVADHWPRSRRDLVAAGIRDPDTLNLLRGICKPCHDRHTAATTPGGWNAG